MRGKRAGKQRERERVKTREGKPNEATQRRQTERDAAKGARETGKVSETRKQRSEGIETVTGLRLDVCEKGIKKEIKKMKRMRDMQPEEVYELLWGKEEEKEIRKGDIQEEQERDYSNLPRFVEFEQAKKDHPLERVFEYKKRKELMSLLMCGSYEELIEDEGIPPETFDFREHMKKYWVEVTGHICPVCGGAIYRNVDGPRRVYVETYGGDNKARATLSIAGYTEPFGELGEFRCLQCLSKLWHCEDCGNFHSMRQEKCSLPAVQIVPHARVITDPDHRYPVIEREVPHDSDELDMCENFDPKFDPYWYNEEDIQKSPLLRTLRSELIKHGDQQIFNYAHTRLNKWLVEAERVWKKKTGLKTLDLHNYAQSPQREHPMTKLEKYLFKFEINKFRLSRREYRTGTQRYLPTKPIVIKHLIPDENGERLITDKSGKIYRYRVRTEKIERGYVYSDGYSVTPEIRNGEENLDMDAEYATRRTQAMAQVKTCAPVCEKVGE